MINAYIQIKKKECKIKIEIPNEGFEKCFKDSHFFNEFPVVGLYAYVDKDLDSFAEYWAQDYDVKKCCKCIRTIF